LIVNALRGAKAPLFHVGARFGEFFRSFTLVQVLESFPLFHVIARFGEFFRSLL